MNDPAAAARREAPRVRPQCDARPLGKEEASIRIAASIAVFALLWYASLRAAAARRGAVNVVAKATFLILTSLACIVIGFLAPMAPGVSAGIGGAFWAGLLASGGTLAGMALSDAILARIEPRHEGASASQEQSKETACQTPPRA